MDDPTPSGDRFPVLDDAFFARLVDVSAEPYVVVDLDGTIRWTSRAGTELLGHGPDAAIGRNMMEFVAPTSAEAALAAFNQYTTPDRPDTGWVGPPIPVDLVLGPDRTVTAEVRMVPTGDLGFPGAVIYLAVHAPETMLYETIERLIAHRPLTEVMDSIVQLISLESPFSVPAIGWGWDGQRFGQVTAHPDVPRLDDTALPTGLAGPTPWELSIDDSGVRTIDDLDVIDSDLRDRAIGAGLAACWVFPLHTTGDHPVDAAVVVWRRTPGPPLLNIARRMERICGLVTLATQAHRTRQLLRTAARTDTVTGLANRTALAEHLDEIADAAETFHVGVLFCDLDRFKAVNDDHGHRVGDQVLATAAGRLRSRVRSQDLVARVGGDEFVVVSTATDPNELHTLANRLLDAFADPISVGDIRAPLGISIGVAVAPPGALGHTLSGEELMASADAALLRAKAAGKGRVERT